MRVLVITAEPKTCNQIRDLVSEAGHDVLAEAGVILGVEASVEFRPDVALVDLALPETSGISVLKNLRNINPGVIVILLCDPHHQKFAVKGVSLGANNYLTKPVESGELEDILEKYDQVLDQGVRGEEIRDQLRNVTYRFEVENRMELLPKMVHFMLSKVGERIGEDHALSVELGLNELLVNAVEHGNLGIGSQEKRQALEQGRTVYYELIEARKQEAVFAARRVRIEMTDTSRYVEWMIEDEGGGFDWDAVPDPTQAGAKLMAHGRGIFLSKMAFDEMEYLGNGNRVRIRKYCLAEPA